MKDIKKHGTWNKQEEVKRLKRGITIAIHCLDNLMGFDTCEHDENIILDARAELMELREGKKWNFEPERDGPDTSFPN